MLSVMLGVLCGLIGPVVLGDARALTRRSSVLRIMASGLFFCGLSVGVAVLSVLLPARHNAGTLDLVGAIHALARKGGPFLYTAGAVLLLVGLLLQVPVVAAHLPPFRRLRKLDHLDLEALVISTSDYEERAAAAQELRRRRRRLDCAAPQQQPDDRLRLGHRGHTPAWYRSVVVIDVFTLIVLGVALVLRRSEPGWPIMLLIMLPFAAHLAATVYQAIRDARRASSTSHSTIPPS